MLNKEQVNSLLSEGFNNDIRYHDEFESKYGIILENVSRPEEINELMIQNGEQEFNTQELECLERAWPFKAVCSDGELLFLLWDIGNDCYRYLGEMKYETIRKQLKLN